MTTIERSTPNSRLMKAINPMMALFVRRGRGKLAQRLLVLHWIGRKSGVAYSTPLSRHELNGRLFTHTRAGFRHNFAGGHPAEVVVDGQRRPVVGTLVDAPDLVARRLRETLDELGTRDGARALGLKLDGDPSVEELTAFVVEDGLVILDFTPA